MRQHNTFRILDATLVVLSCITFGLAMRYVIELRRAPKYNKNPKVDDADMLFTYLTLPLSTLFVTVAESLIYAKDQGLRQSVLAVSIRSLFVGGWLVTVLIWGQCHTQAHFNRASQWPSGESFSSKLQTNSGDND